MWIAILLSAAALFVSGLIYISFKSADFEFFKRLCAGKKSRSKLICLAFYVVLTASLSLTLNVMNAIICMIHLYVFFILFDFGFYIASKVRKKDFKRYYVGALAVVSCIVYLSYGWILAHNVRQTKYTFETNKISKNISLVQITDSHLGTTFDAKGFERHIEEINKHSADVVVVTGDFVDDSTSKEDMLGGCEALGKLKTKYGVYFVWGNHDKGYYSEKSRGWSALELRQALEENGVILLEDEARLIDNSFYIVGRCDRSEDRNGTSRKSADELLSSLDKSKYIILLDHQPHDFDAEAAANADLVLCGHTHGGQFIPINYVGEWIGENCLRYGHEKRLDTDFIVSSGISNWAFKFRTGCFSEYVVIDLIKK